MTIDELARRAGTTTRNVRLLQTLGLLRPPRLTGRTGVYGDGDLARLRAVLRLQGEGFSRAAIRALLDAWDEGRTLADVLRLPRPDAAVVPLALVPGPVADRLAAS